MRRSSETRLFLDTTVIVSAVTKRNIASYNLLLNYKGKIYTNEYVIKECIRVLEMSGLDVRFFLHRTRENLKRLV